jgi:hypothetical protein
MQASAGRHGLTEEEGGVAQPSSSMNSYVAWKSYVIVLL